MGWDCLAYKSYWLRDHFLLVARSDHATGSRNIKPEVVFTVQKMARYASFCLTMGPFKGGVPVFAKLWSVSVRVRYRVSFTTGAVRSAILATANSWASCSVVQFGLAANLFSLTLCFCCPNITTSICCGFVVNLLWKSRCLTVDSADQARQCWIDLYVDWIYQCNLEYSNWHYDTDTQIPHAFQLI